MKKDFIVSLCFIIMGLPLLHAQNQKERKLHSDLQNEIGVGGGIASAMGFVVHGSIGFIEAFFGGLSNQPIDMKWYGQYGVNYHYQVKHWCQLGVKFTIESSKITRYTDTTKWVVKSVSKEVLCVFMPSVRFTYLNRPWVRLYSGVDVGVGYFIDNKDNVSESTRSGNFFFAFNVTPIGVNVGKKFYVMFETNFGFDSVFKVGLGARF
ncbi:MAG: hypothetical protein IJT04_01580 [Bacteroidales bacterium]|nr:hypothetical protein [Bacteroidales bacterium]